jgi:chaperone modulatory protein CbpM
MITIDVLVAQVSGLTRDDLERWISNQWVRPDRQASGYVFREIDVARVRLIREMRDEMEVNEAALPVVLSLLDQLYDLRRHIRDFHEAFAQAAPEEVQRKVAEQLKKPASTPHLSK